MLLAAFQKMPIAQGDLCPFVGVCNSQIQLLKPGPDHCTVVEACVCMAGMALDTQDVADYARSHAKGLRLTFWLFKTDQV